MSRESSIFALWPYVSQEVYQDLAQAACNMSNVSCAHQAELGSPVSSGNCQLPKQFDVVAASFGISPPTECCGSRLLDDGYNCELLTQVSS